MTVRAKLLTILLAMAVFIASAWYIAQGFEWHAAFQYLRGTDFLELILWIWVAHLAYICVRTWRWRILIKNINPDVTFMDLYMVTAITVSLAILTPGQLGEALKVELLRRRGLVSRLAGFGSFALERIMDMVVLCCMCLVGLVFGSGLEDSHPGFGIGVGGLTLGALLSLYLLMRFQPGGRVARWLAEFRNGGGSSAAWLKTAALTLVAWILIGIAWKISLLAIDISLSLPEIIWLISLVTLGTLLSFIPGGLGVAEVLTVEALMSTGVDPIPAQAGALILRAYAMIVVSYGATHLLVWLGFLFLTRVRGHDTPN